MKKSKVLLLLLLMCLNANNLIAKGRGDDLIPRKMPKVLKNSYVFDVKLHKIAMAKGMKYKSSLDMQKWLNNRIMFNRSICVISLSIYKIKDKDVFKEKYVDCLKSGMNNNKTLKNLFHVMMMMNCSNPKGNYIDRAIFKLLSIRPVNVIKNILVEAYVGKSYSCASSNSEI